MIPIYKPYFNKKNLKHAHNAINSGWVSSQGEYLDLSKNKLKEVLGCKRLILTNNGTTATHLLSIALKYKYPHITKIIVPNNVYVAAWNSFLFDKNYELIPIDADLNTWNFNISNLDKLIDNNTAILVVHNLGNIVNVPKLKTRFPTTVIVEDNCEGLFGKYNNKYSGTECFASSISFFGNKTITSGEGGAFITNDDDIFNYINIIKNQGQSDIKFIHNKLGYNYRMTNIQAAILYGQLLDLSIIQQLKQNVFKTYKEQLSNIDQITFQQIESNTEHSNWMVGIRVQDVYLKNKVNNILYQNSIDTRPMFYPITEHLHLKHLNCDVTNSKKLNQEIIILPSYPELTQNQIEFITKKIKKTIN